MQSEPLHPVELLVLATMALVWALATIARLLLPPLLAVLIALVRHHRLEQPAPPPCPPAQPPAPAMPVASSSLAALAEQLVQLPAAEVRALAGIRRKCSRAEAVAVLLHLPI